MSEHLPYALFPEPGKFCIASKLGSRVMTVPEYNETRVVATKWEGSPNQRWFVQRSGRGYKIKNCQYKVYLAASCGKIGTVLGTSEVPTVWTMMRTHDGFVIQFGEEDSVIDLQYGTSNKDNVMVLWKSGDCREGRRWRFERISDDIGEEEAETTEEEFGRLKHENTLRTQQVLHEVQEMGKKIDIINERAASKLQSSFIQEISSAVTRVHKKLDGALEGLNVSGRERSNNSG